MDNDMGFLNELIRTVREQHLLGQDAVADRSDFSVATVSRYENGEREVSARYLRSLLNVTGDPRLSRWLNPIFAERVVIVGTCQCPFCKAKGDAVAESVAMGVADKPANAGGTSTRVDVPCPPPTPKRTPPPPDPADMLPRELESIEKVAAAAKYVNKIVADGIVDASDDQAILNLERLHDEARAIFDSTDRAMRYFREGRRAKS